MNKHSQYSVADYRSAFTVRGPVQGPSSGSIKFNTVITNIGGHYKQNTGYFICEQPGIYKFSVHILQSKLAAGAYCHIKKTKLMSFGRT